MCQGNALDLLLWGKLSQWSGRTAETLVRYLRLEFVNQLCFISCCFWTHPFDINLFNNNYLHAEKHATLLTVCELRACTALNGSSWTPRLHLIRTWLHGYVLTNKRLETCCFWTVLIVALHYLHRHMAQTVFWFKHDFIQQKDIHDTKWVRSSTSINFYDNDRKK